MPLSRPRSRRATGTRKTSQILSKVVTVIVLPASICCQCLAEKPNEIMSSWLKSRSIVILPPRCRAELCNKTRSSPLWGHLLHRWQRRARRTFSNGWRRRGSDRHELCCSVGIPDFGEHLSSSHAAPFPRALPSNFDPPRARLADRWPCSRYRRKFHRFWFAGAVAILPGVHPIDINDDFRGCAAARMLLGMG